MILYRVLTLVSIIDDPACFDILAMHQYVEVGSVSDDHFVA